MRNKSKSLLVLLMSMLMVIGAFGAIAYADDPAEDTTLYDVVFSANDVELKTVLGGENVIPLSDVLEGVGYTEAEDVVGYVYEKPDCIGVSDGFISASNTGDGLLRVTRSGLSTTMDVRVAVTIHDHDWKYSRDPSNVFELSCKDEACPYSEGFTFTLEAEDKVYDGEELEAKVTTSSDDTADFTYEIVFIDKKDPSTLMDSAPTEVGVYNVYAYIYKGESESRFASIWLTDVEITKMPLEVDPAPTASEPVYNGFSQSLISDAGQVKPEGEGTVIFAVTDADAESAPTDPEEWGGGAPTAKDAGEYKVWYKAVPDSEESSYGESEIGCIDASISPKPVHIEWKDKNNTKIYETYELTYNGEEQGVYAHVNGLIGEDKNNVKVTCEDSMAVDTGEYTAKATGFNIEGVENKNYELDSNDDYPTTFDWKINKADLVITPAADQKKKYGEDDPDEFEYELDKLLGEDTADLTLVREEGEDAGEYKFTGYTGLTINGEENKNYEVSFTEDVVFTIEKADLDLNLALEGWTYGDEPKTPVLEGNEGEGAVTYQYKAKDAPDEDYVDEVPVNAGEYTVKATVAETNNYNSGTATAEFTIAKATLTITPKADQKKVYGDEDPALTYDVEGLKNDDSEDVVTGALVRDEGEDVGEYAIGQGTLDAGSNYEISFTPGTFAITPATLTVIPDQNQTKVYGNEDPELKYEVSGLKNGDTISVVTGVLDRAAGEDVGEYAIGQGTIAAGNNYEIAFVDTRVFTITPASLKVTALDQTIDYGKDFDKSKVKYEGFVREDDESALDSTAKVESDYKVNGKPGTYTLTPSGAVAKNYTFEYKSGKLTVNAVENVLVANAVAKGSSKAKLSWNAVTGAASYDIYLNKCNTKGRKYLPKKIATVSSNSFTKKKLKKGTCYKYYVVAKRADGSVISTSKTAHFIAGKVKGKKTNAKSLSVSAKNAVVAVNGTFKIGASQKKVKGGKKYKLLNDKHAPLLRYTSSNPAVATVDANGVITGKSVGYCKVFVQTVNGIWQEIEVDVK